MVHCAAKLRCLLKTLFFQYFFVGIQNGLISNLISCASVSISNRFNILLLFFILVANENYDERSSLIVVFLTHGGPKGTLYTKDGKIVTSEEIWKFFSSHDCPSLNEKPKIFIFQVRYLDPYLY